MININLYHGDCIEVMKTLPEKSFDLVLTDPPYGTTKCHWDKPIDMGLMWSELKRIIKDNTAILFCSQYPFNADLAVSNKAMRRYEWIYQKQFVTGHLNANIAPMKEHENILVFYKLLPTFNPQKTQGHEPVHSFNKGHHADGDCYNETKGASGGGNTDRYPRSIQSFEFRKDEEIFMPTQKPISMMAYFIETYSNKGDSVLDITMGSCPVGVACVETGRHFTGIDITDKHYLYAKERIQRAQMSVPALLTSVEKEVVNEH